jgi:hypothetical protein
MIRSITVVHRASAETFPGAAAVALIAIGTPGCDITVRPDLLALRLSFDTLAGELEAACLRVAQAAAAVPFAIAHAKAISTFVAELQQQGQPIDLLVYESEGYSRSVTVARWAAQRLGCRLHEPRSAARVPSCSLMDAVLCDLPRQAQPVTRPAARASEPELQP